MTYLTNGEPSLGPVDQDGHQIDYWVDRFGDRSIVIVSIQRGVSAESAAAILRKLANHLERNATLLTARQGAEGHFNNDGLAEPSILSLEGDYDDFGDLGPRPQAQ